MNRRTFLALLPLAALPDQSAAQQKPNTAQKKAVPPQKKSPPPLPPEPPATKPAALLGKGEFPRRRVLLVAVTGYRKGRFTELNTRPDVGLIRQGLQERFHFTDDEIYVLDRAATTTHDAIQMAFEQWLIAPTQAGDTIYFHFSGHGDNAVLDSQFRHTLSLVPSDYLDNPSVQRPSANHITAAELATWVNALKAKLQGGQLFLTFDCCHSGQLVAGVRDARRHLVRGPDPAFPYTPLPSQPAPAAPPPTETVLSTQTTPGRGFAALMACRFDQKANETGPHPLASGEQGEVGLLSYYLAEGLQHATPEWTYQDLYDYVNCRMAAVQDNQNPVLEGDRQFRLFDGKAEPLPEAIPVLLSRDGALLLRAGKLNLVTPGSRYTLYPEGTRRFDQATPLGQAKVSRVRAGDAELVPLDTQGKPQPSADRARFRGARAMLQERAFIDDPLRVDIGPLRHNAGIVAELSKALARSGLVQLLPTGSRADAQVRVALVSDGFQLSDAQSDTPLGDPVRLDSLAPALERQARSRYLRALTGDGTGVRLAVRIVPCETELDKGNRLWVRDLPLEPQRRWSAAAEDYFTIQVCNRSPFPAYLTVFDIDAAGTVSGLWPQQNTERYLPAARPGKEDWYTIAVAGELYHPTLNPQARPQTQFVTEPFGTEVIKVIATQQPTDLTPLADQFWDGGRMVPHGGADTHGSRGAEHPLARYLAQLRLAQGQRSGVASAPVADWGVATLAFLAER